MNQPYSSIYHNIQMLGEFLGETIRDAQGDYILDLIESIRVLSRNSRSGREFLAAAHSRPLPATV